MKYIKYVFLIIATTTFYACKVSYGFSPPQSIEADTFQVNQVEYSAILFEPGLDLDFRNALISIIENQTNLSNVNTGGDLVYEVEITTYRISPTTATSQNTAAQNRLTIGVKVSFYNTNNEEDDLESSFSFFYDFPGNAQLVGAQKTTAHEEVFERITQDIFNATLARW